MIKKKYKKENSELIKSIQDMGRDIAVLEIKLVGTSKVKDNLIYECAYTDKGNIKNVSIKIAIESVEKLLRNSMDKSKLDKIYLSSIEETKLALKKKSS